MKDNKLERLKAAIDMLKKAQWLKTNADIAERLGYKRVNSISDIVNGRQTLTDKFLIAFSGAYPISLQWLQHGTGPQTRDLTREEHEQGYNQAFTTIIGTARAAAEHDVPYKKLKPYTAQQLQALDTLLADDDMLDVQILKQAILQQNKRITTLEKKMDELLKKK